MRRRGGWLSALWAAPWGKAIIILVVVGAIALWIYTQVQEYQEGERLRERDRK